MSPLASDTKPTIARIWRGCVRAERADEYADYIYEHGIRPLEEKALGVQLLREDREGESEFVTISYWENVDTMSRFAGKDPRRIHYLERDPEFLIELPREVQVLSIASASGRTGRKNRQSVTVKSRDPIATSIRHPECEPRIRPLAGPMTGSASLEGWRRHRKPVRAAARIRIFPDP